MNSCSFINKTHLQRFSVNQIYRISYGPSVAVRDKISNNIYIVIIIVIVHDGKAVFTIRMIEYHFLWSAVTVLRVTSHQVAVFGKINIPAVFLIYNDSLRRGAVRLRRVKIPTCVITRYPVFLSTGKSHVCYDDYRNNALNYILHIFVVYYLFFIDAANLLSYFFSFANI